MGMAMSPQANVEGAAAVPHFKMNMKMQMYLLP
jgi:hypothetical protein